MCMEKMSALRRTKEVTFVFKVGRSRLAIQQKREHRAEFSSRYETYDRYPQRNPRKPVSVQALDAGSVFVYRQNEIARSRMPVTPGMYAFSDRKGAIQYRNESTDSYFSPLEIWKCEVPAHSLFRTGEVRFLDKQSKLQILRGICVSRLIPRTKLRVR